MEQILRFVEQRERVKAKEERTMIEKIEELEGKLIELQEACTRKENAKKRHHSH